MHSCILLDTKIEANMIFTKRHSSDKTLIEAFQLPISFDKGVNWLAQLITNKTFVFNDDNNQIISISTLDGSLTAQKGDWIVKKDDNQYWLLSNQRMNDFFVYAPGQIMSTYVDLSQLFIKPFVVDMSLNEESKDDVGITKEESDVIKDDAPIVVTSTKSPRARRTVRQNNVG